MSKRIKLALVVAVAVVALAAFASVGFATGQLDDDEAPITGVELERASAAALAHTGEGRVTDTEVGDEESYYEVEVTLEGGQQVDVQLDRDFTVVGDEMDDKEEANDD